MAVESFAPIPESVYVRGFPESRYLTVHPFVLEAFDSDRYHEPWPYRHICIADIGGFRDNRIVKKVFRDLPTISLNIPQEYHDPPRRGDVTCDGFQMPLETNSIPVVIAVDVLEQIHPANRLRLIQEMVRVAQERVVIACPFYSLENAGDEIALLNRMREANLPEKRSIRIHRELGLPKMNELVDMARQVRLPFEIWPATDRHLDFNSLSQQVEILNMKTGEFPDRERVELAKQLAAYQDLNLRASSIGYRPTWRDAYRAVLIIDKNKPGRVLDNDRDYIFSSTESTAYGLALSRAWYEGHYQIPRILDQWNYSLPSEETALRGFNIAFEGPDGSGKTDTISAVAEKLAAWGYTVATPMKYGSRQRLREMEREIGAIVNKNQREALLASATNEAMIAANAHKLLGPCHISLADRTLASTNNIYHRIYGTDEGSAFALKGAHQIPPDLTFVLEVDDFEENWRRKEVKGDLANAKIDRENLMLQRKYYGELTPNRYTGPIYRVKSNGTVEETAEKVLREIENFLKIPTQRL